MKNFLILSVAVSVLFVSFYFGIKKNERHECLKWQAEALEFENYYLLDWQWMQCERLGVKIPATVISTR